MEGAVAVDVRTPSRSRRWEDTIDTPHWRHNNVTTFCSCSELFSQLTQYHRTASCFRRFAWVRPDTPTYGCARLRPPPPPAAGIASTTRQSRFTTATVFESCCNSFRKDGGLDAQNDDGDHATLRFYSNAAQLYKNVTRPPRCVTKVYNCGWLPTHVYKGLNLVPVAVHLAMAW